MVPRMLIYGQVPVRCDNCETVGLTIALGVELANQETDTAEDLRIYRGIGEVSVVRMVCGSCGHHQLETEDKIEEEGRVTPS
jgi:hypothetical protein